MWIAIDGYLLLTNFYCGMSLHGYPCLDINVDIHACINNWRLTSKNHGYPCWYPWIVGKPCMDLLWILSVESTESTQLSPRSRSMPPSKPKGFLASKYELWLLDCNRRCKFRAPPPLLSAQYFGFLNELLRNKESVPLPFNWTLSSFYLTVRGKESMSSSPKLFPFEMSRY